MTNPFRALRALLGRKSALQTSADLYRVLMGGRESAAGVSVTEHTALSVAAVMSCVSLIARSIASLPLAVYERLEDGKSKQPAPNHPIARVLSQPNSWQTWTDFLQMGQSHALLRGNAYAWENWGLVDGREQLLELIPIHPDRLKVELATDPMDPARGLTQNPLKYTYMRKTGEPIPLPADEVLHLRGLSTNGYLGRAVLEDAREMIGLAIATQEHASTYWASGGLPDIVLRHPRTLGDKARKNLEQSWEHTYGTSKDKRRVAITEEGMEIHQLTLNATDMQFLQTRQFQRGEIAGWFHVPPHMIGDTEKSTSWGTGIEQQQIGFLMFCLLPWLRAWERRLNRDLITAPQRFFVEFRMEGFMRGDAASRGNFYWLMRQIGAFSANDVRALENMNPIEGGDIYLQPTNLAPLGWQPAGGSTGGSPQGTNA